MSKASATETILSQAADKERQYDWVGAAESYDKALITAATQDLHSKSEIQEKIAYSFFRAALQAETHEQFRKRMQLAADHYSDAAELLTATEETKTCPQFNNCKAMATYVRSWLASEPSAKKERLNESWKFAKEALKLDEKTTDQINLGKTCNNITTILTDRLNIEWDAQSREKIIEEALECGEKAIDIFHKIQDNHQLAQAYINTAYFCRNAAFAKGLEAERREDYQQKALNYGQKAIETSENTDDAYLIGLSHLCLADARLDILGSAGLQEKHRYEAALQSGKLTKDNLIIANALFGLQYATSSYAKAQADPDRAREEYEKFHKYWEDAYHHFSLASCDSGIAMSYTQLNTAILDQSKLEPEINNRRLLLEKSVALGYKGLEHARLSGSMGVTFHMTRSLGVIISGLSKIETNLSRKIGLLNDSAKLIEQAIGILEQASAASLVEPREINLALTIWSLARHQADSARVEMNIQARIELLEKAAANIRGARDCWLAWAKSQSAPIEKPLWFMAGGHEMTSGQTLAELYTLTGDISFSEASLDAFKSCVSAYEKADVPARVAEAYWQIAKAYNRLAEYSESAKNFELASQNYKLAATKIPQLNEFYADYAIYMQAWHEIEKARNKHKKEEYLTAKEHYEKAAELHNSTVRWRHLGSNYLAWAKLDEAEDLSRQEKTEDARHIFDQAAELFAEAKHSVQTKPETAEAKDEKELVVNLAEAAELRYKYCLGRATLEEAKALDRQGHHAASAAKYGSAAEEFQKIIGTMKNESDRKEIEPIVYLCKAWQMMTRAEAEASPSLYLEASRLFEKAKEQSSTERAKLLALGHSHFCQALEAGIRFEDTRDMNFYSTAKKHIDAAENYYVRAVFKNASEHAKATYLLLDAYLFMHQAETETDPANKATHYQMAEKLLQSSTSSYVKANQQGKSETVGRLLESVKEKRQLAVSLTELLYTPGITSTTASFPTPTPTREEPAGLERFEQADVQANLILGAKEAKVGDELDFEIELTNAGKAPASLIRIEEIAPESFEIKRIPEIYRIEDSCLNMKGKRLNPLASEELKVTVIPLDRGKFTIKPRVIYTDETGSKRSHETEHIMLTVKELGIKD